MARFFGYRSVMADLRHHLRGTGKVTSATLKLRGTDDAATDVAWKYCYVHPQQETTGYGGEGHPDIHGTITLWRLGETSAPRVDDKLTVGSTTYLIQAVTPERNADESSNFAVYQLSVVS